MPATFSIDAADPQQLGIARDEPGERVRLPHRLQPPVLLLQVVQAERAVDGQRQQLGLERLGEEVVGAEPDRAHGVGAVVLPGQHDHLGVRRELEDLLEQLEALA